jgi:glycosyltransferase involved in cell wall biosynthesis
MNLSPPLQRIGVSLGNIGALHDGLGEYAWQIGRRIAAAAPAWRARYGIAFDFHLFAGLGRLFGGDVGYLGVTRWQRLRHVQTEPHALWHSLHQHNKTLPPRGCTRRLVTVHDLNHLYEPNALSRWRQQRRLRALVARSDHLVAISRHTAEDVRRHLGWRGPLDVIYNGARSLVGAPQRPLPGWEPAPPRPFLFHLSRMSASKNPQAIIALARAWPQMSFVLCGPPSDEARKLRAHNALPNVQFHLGIDDAQKAWCYAHCAGFLFPSITEGFGLPPLEAMHFGRPVFLSRRTSLPEIGGAVAEYFDDDFDPLGMRAVVERALLRAREPAYGEALRAHAAQFDWDRAAAACLALYERMLGLNHATAAEATPAAPAEREAAAPPTHG